MRPLDVLHLDDQTFWSGGQAQALRLARALRERGHRQAFAVPGGTPLADRARAEGFAVHALAPRGDVDPPATFRLARLVRRLDPDVLHAHDAHTLAHAALAARIGRRRPAVVAHRRVDFPLRGHVFSRWKYARGPDRLIAVSRHVADVLVAGGVPPVRIAVVPDAIDRGGPGDGGDGRERGPGEPRRRDGSGAETRPASPLRARIGASEHAAIVVTFAALVERKDHPTLIAAAERLLGRHDGVVWAVFGEGRLLEETRREVAARGLDERLVYAGFVEEARALLGEADVFALPSRREAFGSSLLEAMDAGVPVVATRVGGIPEVVEDGQNGVLVPPERPDRLADAVERLLGDRRLRARLASAAERSLARFEAPRVADEVEEVYRDALAGR